MDVDNNNIDQLWFGMLSLSQAFKSRVKVSWNLLEQLLLIKNHKVVTLRFSNRESNLLKSQKTTLKSMFPI